MSNLLKCKMCNQYEARQLFQHLKSKHGITTSEYRNKFGKNEIVQIGFTPSDTRVKPNNIQSEQVKKTYIGIEHKLNLIVNIYTKEEVRKILLENDRFKRYFGKSKNRTLIVEDAKLYKSIKEHTKILDEIAIDKINFNYLSKRIKFIVDYNYDERLLKCRCGNSFTFNNGCRLCADNKNNFLGKTHTQETLTKLRLSAIKRIERQIGQLAPAYNINSIAIIEKFGKENGFNFQHAENGGEFKVPGLGYWVDAYDSKKNVVLEIDERQHFDKFGNLIERDVKRQNEIISVLGCQFYRIKL